MTLRNPTFGLRRTASSNWPANLHGFSDDSKVVLSIAADDLPGTQHGVHTVLPGFGGFSNVRAESTNAAKGHAVDPILRSPDDALGQDRAAVRGADGGAGR